MPIYTKTGDAGITTIFGGGKISKSHPQIKACGDLDELNSFIGLTLLKIKKSDKSLLTQIQKDLYLIMGNLAGSNQKLSSLENEIDKFENIIDSLTTKLPNLKRFILPQGTEESCNFHVLRAVCRRAERNIVEYLNQKENQQDKIIIKYINRLSDLFFTLARYYNNTVELRY